MKKAKSLQEYGVSQEVYESLLTPLKDKSFNQAQIDKLFFRNSPIDSIVMLLDEYDLLYKLLSPCFGTIHN